jgi:predicted MFS family arabinose efflux permease
MNSPLSSGTSSAHLPIKESMLLLLLAAINFTHIMDFVIMAPLNPFLRDELSISTKQFGLLLSSYTLSAALGGIIGAFFIDKFDRRKSLLLLYIGFTLGNFICAIADHYATFMAARILAGGFGGVLGSIIFSIIGDVVPPERRGKATGFVMAAFSAASILGIPAGIYLANHLNWHAPFYLLAGLSILVLLSIWFYMPSITSHIQTGPQSSGQKILALFASANVRWALFFMVLLMLAGFTVVPFLSDYLVSNVGIDKGDLGFVYLFGGLATVISSPLTGRLADKFGKQKVFVWGAISSLVPIYIMTHLPPSSYTFTFIMSTLFFIVFGARFVPAIAMITSSVQMYQRGSFMSISSSVQQIGSSIAVGIAGLIVHNTPDGTMQNFGLCGIIACIATLLCIFVSYKIKQVS